MIEAAKKTSFILGDEMKVESFELADPLGNKNIFAKFEDGLVFYKFPGIQYNQPQETTLRI
jgi:hypothetical protein